METNAYPFHKLIDFLHFTFLFRITYGNFCKILEIPTSRQWRWSNIKWNLKEKWWGMFLRCNATHKMKLEEIRRETMLITCNRCCACDNGHFFARIYSFNLETVLIFVCQSLNHFVYGTKCTCVYQSHTHARTHCDAIW